MFTEIRATFVNGLYASTIILAQAVIEQWLSGIVYEKGYLSPNERPGMGKIVNCLRENDLIHPYLIDKVDQLRRIRNPFTHLRPAGDIDGLDQRSVSLERSHFDVLEDDAKKALALMYEIIQSRF